MSKIKLTGSNSGYVEIDSAADAGNLTLTLPTSGVRLLSNTDNVFSGITTTGELDINGKIDVSTDAVIARNLSVGGITTHTGTTTLSDDVTFTGASYNVLWDKSDNQLEFADNAKISFGGQADMRLFHDGTNSVITNATGDLYINNNADTIIKPANDLFLKPQDGENGISVIGNGAVELYFNNSKKVETTNTGAIVTGICTATSFSGSGENLTRTTQLSHRNLIINGDMRIAQRAVSSTSAGYRTVDRISQGFANVNENPTMQRVALAVPSSPYNLPTSGTHPYKEGFRYAYYVQNGNQTTAAGANQDISSTYKIEAQDLVGSGWNFADPNSYLTISFWVKTSVAQTYYVGFRLYGPSDGNQREYCFNFTPAAFTWTKVTHSIPGHASNTLREDNAMGAFIQFIQYWGTNYTSSGRTNEAWQAKNNNSNYPDVAGNWYNTNDASYQITGLQLEVGQQATPFEHRRYDDQLFACQRYYCELGRRINFDGSAATGDSKYSFIGLQAYTTSNLFGTLANFPRKMRVKPTVTTVGHIKFSDKQGSNIFAPNASTYTAITHETVGTHGIAFSSSRFIQGGFACGFTDNDNATYNYIKADAEF